LDKAGDCFELARKQHEAAEIQHANADRQLDNADKHHANATEQEAIAAKQHERASVIATAADKLQSLGHSLEADAVKITSNTGILLQVPARE